MLITTESNSRIAVKQGYIEKHRTGGGWWWCLASITERGRPSTQFVLLIKSGRKGSGRRVADGAARAAVNDHRSTEREMVTQGARGRTVSLDCAIIYLFIIFFCPFF